MGTPLNLFPQRAAIGRVDARGDVYMTDEFTRALAALLVRVGGPNSGDMGELAIELATQGNAAALSVARSIADLELQLAQAVQLTARLAELRKQVAALEAQLVQVAPPTDWEHPGKIGASKANSGKFTTLDASGAVTFKPIGADLVTIQPAQPGQVDNMELGKTTPRPARVTTLNNVTVIAPATSAQLTLQDGATLTVPAPGGTLGSAAYAAASSFAARSVVPFGPVATDPASTQALANNIRDILHSVGIGT